MLPKRRHASFALGVGIMLLAAACGGDATGPGNVNPGATAAKLEAFDDAFETPTFRSFALAAGFVTTATASLGDLRAALSMVQAGPGTPPAIHVVRHTLDQRRGARSEMVFPPEILGKTFEWNPTSGSYEVTTRAGAPANGVRFILYALEIGGLPATPLQEIGYVDFKDESNFSFEKLHVVVAAGGTTYVDYTITIDGATFDFSLAGFATDGTRRLDFSLTLHATNTVISEDITFDINAENAHVRLTVDSEILSETSLRSTIDYRIQFGAEVVTLTGIINLNGTAVTGSLTIRLNGRDYATFTFNDAGGEWTGAGGRALSPEDGQALTAIFSAVGNLFFQLITLLLI